MGTQQVGGDFDPVGATSVATDGIAAKTAPTSATPTGQPTSQHGRRWHSLDADESVSLLDSDGTHGLAQEDAAERLTRFGANELAIEERRSILAIVIAQFTDFMILVLLAAALISGLLGELRDTLAIVLILVLNAAVGAVQEFRAQRAVAALKKMAAPEARVVRGGRQANVPAAELVPGDLVTLGAGDVVPADLRLLESLNLHADESALTGEPVPVSKHVAQLPDEDLALGDRRNMAFKQTSVTKGTGRGLVVATGLRTEIGRIAELLAERSDERTPLQRRLAVFGQRLALAVLAICALIFTLGVLTGQPPLLMFMTALSLAVAAIPEALPAVVTIALAIGAAKLTKQRSLVRRLPAVESLGSVTFICADKTGTLTENRMTLAAFVAAGKEVIDLARLTAPLRDRAGAVLALCNDVDPISGRSTDPTETALYEAARNSGFDKAALRAQFPRLAVLAFDTDRKLMTTLHRQDGGVVALCKGAPEQVFAHCTTALDSDGAVRAFDRAAADGALDDLSRRGFRVLALAFRDLAALPDDAARAAVEAELTFVGLVALRDPVRPEVPRAIAECRSAGITPIMITGDHPQTARNVSHELGIGDGDGDREILTGRDLNELSDAALEERLRRVRVFARIDPAQKIRIVEVLQNAGEFVAMTGDGVNDAPALKRASIGIAMGQRGTDVAREAADIVLLDDNFATIVAAVREGRRVYDNIRKFVKNAMAGNFGEILVLLIASLAGLPLPLLPLHILWINLVTDGLPGLAFSAEPEEQDIMRRRPRHPRESMFAAGLWQHIAWAGALIGSLSLLTVVFADPGNLPQWQTMVFTTLVTAQLFHPLAIRSDRDSLFSIGLFSNRYLIGAIAVTFLAQLLVVYVPFLNPVLRTTPLPLTDLLVCFGLGFAILPAVEIAKWLKRRRAPEERVEPRSRKESRLKSLPRYPFRMVAMMPISRHIWDTKYRFRGPAGARDEAIEDTWRRVAHALAAAEPEPRRGDSFYRTLGDFRFLPGGRIQAGAGTGRRVTLFNCFVMGGLEDSIDGIFDGLKEGALTMQQGGGVGYDFSTLRPQGMPAKAVGGVASGPVSFMRIWDAMCATLLSTGARRGAMMATLRCDHPDIEQFIAAKHTPGQLRNFNLSVLVTDELMRAVQDGADWALVFPEPEPASGRETTLRRWSGTSGPVACRIHRRVPARMLWEKLMRATYDYAEPGVLFIDRINRLNNLWYCEQISATNPCGELPLPPYGACDLGSINLTAFVRDPFGVRARLDLDAVAETAHVAVRMLDDVIDVSRFPLAKQAEMARGARRIGLGLTGLADTLIMLGLHYGEPPARELAARIMQTICHGAYRSSIELAREKGSFPFFDRDRYLSGEHMRSLPGDIREGIARYGIRNSHLTAIAPTGTISLLANNVSSGIEPVYDFQHTRRVLELDGRTVEHALTDYALERWRALHGDAPLPRAFVRAHELPPASHLDMQAALQPYVDNSISKTINVPEELPFERFKDIYRNAFDLGLKGCTTYRPNAVTGAVLEGSIEPAQLCCVPEREAD